MTNTNVTQKHKVSELSGVLLDLAVAMAEGKTARIQDWHGRPYCAALTDGYEDWYQSYHPSTYWVSGGEIIEREGITVSPFCMANDKITRWLAWTQWPMSDTGLRVSGETPLIAAMRCYVASRYGDEIELPEIAP